MLECLTERWYSQSWALSGWASAFPIPHRYFYTVGRTVVTSPVTIAFWKTVVTSLVTICLLAVSKVARFVIAFLVCCSPFNLLQSQGSSLLQDKAYLEATWNKTYLLVLSQPSVGIHSLWQFTNLYYKQEISATPTFQLPLPQSNLPLQTLIRLNRVFKSTPLHLFCSLYTRCCPLGVWPSL